MSEEYRHLKPGNFQYVDVRFDTKVFVNEHIAPLVSTTATSTGVVSTTTENLPE
jgi:hypothetical protein